jgi:hypothetical protein
MNRLTVGATLVMSAAVIAATAHIYALRTELTKLQFETSQLRVRAEADAKQIQSSQTTEFVAVFPQNLAAITQLTKRARVRLVVVTDFCAYGHYSNPSGFDDYMAALVAVKAEGREVELHIYDEKTADEMTKSQFDLDKPDGGVAAFNGERSQQRFNAYFDYHEKKGQPRSKPATVAEFVQLMNEEQARCIKELSSNGILIRADISRPLPLFLWIRDEEEALVSMYNLGSSSREMSLRTRDRSLLSLLNQIAARR